MNYFFKVIIFSTMNVQSYRCGNLYPNSSEVIYNHWLHSKTFKVFNVDVNLLHDISSRLGGR